VDEELEALKRELAQGGLRRWKTSCPIVVIPTIFIGLPWVILHYITKWKTAATLTGSDEALLEELYQLARRLDERMETVERLSPDHPEFHPGGPKASANRRREIDTSRCAERMRARSAEGTAVNPSTPAFTGQGQWQVHGRVRRPCRLYRDRRAVDARGHAGGDQLLRLSAAGLHCHRHPGRRQAARPVSDREEQRFWQGVRNRPAAPRRSARQLPRHRPPPGRGGGLYVSSNPRLSDEIERLR
jgi:phage shock protein B